jgi:hypothetical protein
LTHRHGAVGGLESEGHLLLSGFETEEGARVAHGEALLGEKLLYLEGKAEEAEHVGDGGAVLACPLGNLVVGEMKFAVEAIKGVGYFDRVEVLALDVFDKRNFHEAIVGKFLDDDGHFMKAGNAGGAESALSSD